MPRFLAPVACTLLLIGCIGLHSNQPAQQQYSLDLLAPSAQSPGSSAGAAHSGLSATLQVLEPVASAGLIGEGIAALRAGERLDYYTNARWAEDAPTMLQTLLIQALRSRGNFALVEPGAGAFGARYMLSMDITHFEADYQGAGPPTVRVSLVCTLGRRSDRSPITTLMVESTVTASADRMQQVIAAFQQATNQALWRIAEQLTPPTLAAPAPS